LPPAESGRTDLFLGFCEYVARTLVRERE